MRRFLRVLGILITSLVLLGVLLVGAAYINAQRILGARYSNPVANVKVAGTPQQLARGEQLVTSVPGCVGCHASNPQAAGKPVLDGARVEDVVQFGDFWAPNLTPVGRLKDWTDGEIIRAIREGLSRDGRPLLVMPSDDFKNLSDEDVQSVVAYLRSMPAIQRELPPVQPNLLAIVLLGANQLPTAVQQPVGTVPAVAVGATPAYGEYLVAIGGCRTCHGANLDGQNIPTGPPPGPSLAVVKGWSQDQFFRTLREGVDPSGHVLDPVRMPWRQVGRLPDMELRALYLYLNTR